MSLRSCGLLATVFGQSRLMTTPEWRSRAYLRLPHLTDAVEKGLVIFGEQ
jgi:hypothetical protein